MKLCTSWLRDWVTPEATTEEICQKLTNAGLEVDSVKRVGAPFEGVIVVTITEVRPHPSASHLNVCSIRSDRDSFEVVCGAPNVAVGLKTAYAPIGAKLRDGIVVNRKSIKGVESNGMLCSSKELGLDEHGQVIVSLDDAFELGKPLSEVLQMDDEVVEFDLTPNRGDCFSMLGVAREVSVLCDCSLSTPSIQSPRETISDRIEIHLDDSVGCPLYLGRIIKSVDVNAPTPWQLSHRLRCAGIRSINVIVDILNYVMLELGQPMHAFDLTYVENGIVVRKALNGEKLILLDGSEATLDSETLLIVSEDNPVAIAGVVGGLASAVQPSTVDILLEVAYFSPANLLGVARRYGLHTDASTRYERGVDPTIQKTAMNRATELILQYAGGSSGPICEARAEKYLPKRRQIKASYERIENLTGCQFDATLIDQLLTKIGCEIETSNGEFTLTTPPHRFDLAIEEDLVEEVCRIVGYDQIPPSPLHGILDIKSSPRARGDAGDLRQRLVHLGYNEVVTYSFIHHETSALFSDSQLAVTVANPISSDRDTMRASLIPGLIQVCTYNVARQQNAGCIFEYGQCFIHKNDELVQKNLVGGLLWGRREPESWVASKDTVDIFDVKGDIESLIGRNCEWKPAAINWLSPSCSAEVIVDDVSLGVIGKLSDEIVQKFELDSEVYVFELEADVLGKNKKLTMQPISSYPSVRRDLAIVLKKQVTASEIELLVREVSGELLKQFIVFDVYESEGLGKDNKSMGIGMIFQHLSRTLEDSEVNQLLERITRQLGTRFNASLR